MAGPRPGPRPYRKVSRTVKTCPVCENPFEVGGGAGSLKKRFCSYKCRGEHSRKDIDENPDTKLGSTMWRRRRKEVLERDGYTCRFCKEKTTKTVHHLIPRAYGGSHKMSNLAAACYFCHDAVDKTIRIMTQLNPAVDLQAWLDTFFKPS